MSDLKMSDVFELPLRENRVESRLGAAWCISGKAPHVAHAINNHDRLVEEIAQLKADKAELVEMLKSISESNCRTIDIAHEINDLLQKHKG